MNKAEISYLAKQLMLELSEDELIKVEKSFEVFNKQLLLLDKLDTNNIQEMVFPFEEKTDFMREDVVSDMLTSQEVLLNAKEKENDLLVIAKVSNR